MIDFRTKLLASTLLATLAATPALAQTVPVEATPEVAQDQAEPEARDIVVTGSRIQNPNLVQANPVQVVNAEEIAQRAPVSIEQVLRQLPGVAPGINPSVNNGSNGTASFNFRNLGADRNLVLINNRRIVPSTIGNIVDLNVVPVALIERSDILSGGAVTTYGADAISGVLNFVTKSDFEGLQLDGQYNISERGDGAGFRFDVTAGGNFADNRGNAVIGLSYTNTSPVTQGSRPIGLFSRASNCLASQLVAGVCNIPVGSNQGSITATPASLISPLPLGAPNAGQPNAVIDPTRSGGARFDPVTGTIAPGFSDFNFNPLNYFQTPLDRYSAFGSARYEVAPNITAYTEAFFVRSRVVQELAPTGTFSEEFQLPLNNQFLTPAQRSQLCLFAQRTDCATAIPAGTPITAIVSRRFTESGPRRAEITSNLFQVTAGVRGSITQGLNFDVFAQHGEAERRATSFNGALRSRVQQGLLGCPAGGLAPGCVPINLFGGEGSLTPAMLAFISVPTTQTTNTQLTSVQGIVSGDLGFTSPFATSPVGIAVGAEYRRNNASQLGDVPNQIPGEILGAGGAFLTVDGAIDSREIFGEINVPIASNVPLVTELTVDAGIRYADYSTTGGNTTWKAGLRFAPIPDVTFRGAYTFAVRAPNVGELFLPTNTILNNLAVDPCQGNVTNVTTRAICAAQLARVGASAGLLGSIPAPIAGQINVTLPGTPNLDTEKARTITAGVIVRPTSVDFLRGFAFTADWVRIRVRDAITTPTVGDILNGCFSQANPNDPRCAAIGRNPLTGGLSGSPASTLGPTLVRSNQGFLEYEGVDLTASYDRTFGDVRFGVFSSATYVDKSRFQASPLSFIRECVGRYSVNCSSPLPQWVVSTRGTLGFGPGTISLLWRHIDGLQYEGEMNTTPPPAGSAATVRPGAPAPGTVGSYGSVNPRVIVPAYRSIPSYNYFDLNVGVDVTDDVRFTLLVSNLLDRRPPDVGNTIGSTTFNSGNTFPSVYDVIGRSFVISTRLRF